MFTDSRRFSTTTTTQPGTSPRDVIAPITGLLEAFQWRSLAIIVDLESASRNAPRVYGVMLSLKAQFRGFNGGLDVGFFEVDSSTELDPYHTILRKAANQSRSRKVNLKLLTPLGVLVTRRNKKLRS